MMMPNTATFAAAQTTQSLQFGLFSRLAGAVQSGPARLVYTGLSPPSIGRLFFLLRPS
jgi:hypothetical protein